ncbi:MAG: GrpB family protein [Aulosira sp. ZfuVER01]|nr:GrpB family protein [Aulosira sp. ZfuVER01]MDZ7999993.1 GrpB family protein [Aulosira sp. DedVER01a]MDZ8051432.1 GrpB family protein [Aulosira sp. ZfuCHP01]
MKVEVVPHDPTWRVKFEHESKLVASALGDNVIAIHHIGSTAIPHIYAKPIIDILVEVKDIAKVDKQNSQMAVLGYKAMGEFGLPGRRFFRKHDETGTRTHHVHTFEINFSGVQRHLAFRDYMIAHPEEANKYSELKRQLAKQYPDDINGYIDGKDGFIKDREKRALEWKRSQNISLQQNT